MSAKKQRTPKSTEKVVEKPKYASRYVQAILDQLIADRLTRCRYPKATDKWLKKAKINLLRKLSEQSQTVFRRGPSVEQLRDEVSELTRRIQDQQQHIREFLDREGRASTTALVARPASLQAPYEAGQFDEAAGRIQQQFGQVAQLLGSVAHELDGRCAGMEETVGAAKKQVQPMLAELRASKAVAKPAATRGAQHGGGNRRASAGASAASAGASGASALQQVQKILGRK